MAGRGCLDESRRRLLTGLPPAYSAAQGALLLVLFQTSHVVEHRLTERAQGNLAALYDTMPKAAVLVQLAPGGGPDLATAQRVRAADVPVGACMLVKPGEQVRVGWPPCEHLGGARQGRVEGQGIDACIAAFPGLAVQPPGATPLPPACLTAPATNHQPLQVPLDGQVVHGRAMVSAEHITGESLPVLSRVGDEVAAGSLNRDGVLVLRALRPAEESTPARIAKLTLDAQVRAGHGVAALYVSERRREQPGLGGSTSPHSSCYLVTSAKPSCRPTHPPTLHPYLQAKRPQLHTWLDQFGEMYSKGVIAATLAMLAVLLLTGVPLLGAAGEVRAGQAG